MLITQREQQGGFSTLGKRRNMILEKVNGGFTSAGFDSKQAIFDNTVLSSHNGFKSSNTDSNEVELCGGHDTFLNDINNDLDFFENNENKDSKDFLYYGWPEIGSFEDIDGMFRNCDSEMSWLPLSAENISEKEYSLNDSGMTSFWASERCDDDDNCMSFVNGPNNKAAADSRDEVTLGKNQSEWESKEHYFGNGGFDREVTQLPTVINSDQAFLDVQRQLRQSMNQVDLRTKLCIRDSLYRLAKGAAKRHNRSTAQGTNECTSFMDIERQTNPLDRSIAHLLFHRPLDLSTKPSKVQGPIAIPSLLNENCFSESTTASEAEKVSCC